MTEQTTIPQPPGPRSVFFIRREPRERWRQLGSLRDVLKVARNASFDICVVDLTEEAFSRSFGTWRQVFGHDDLAVNDVLEATPVGLPWLQMETDRDILWATVGAADGILLVHLQSLGSLGQHGWLQDPRSDVTAAVAKFLNGPGRSVTVQEAASELPEHFASVISTIASTEMHEVSSRALSLSKIYDAESTSLHLDNLSGIRIRQRIAEAAFWQKGSMSSGSLRVLQRTVDEVDALMTIMITQQLLQLNAAAKSEAARREDDARQERAEVRILTMLAALFLPPTIVLSFFGVSNSPATFAGIRQESLTGQILISGVAVISAALLFILIRWLLAKTKGTT